MVKSRVKSVHRSLENLSYKRCHAILVNSHHFTVNICFSKKFSALQHHHLILVEFPMPSLSPAAEPASPFQNLFISHARRQQGLSAPTCMGHSSVETEDMIFTIGKLFSPFRGKSNRKFSC